MTSSGDDLLSKEGGEASEVNKREPRCGMIEKESAEDGAFSERFATHTFNGFLFDLDGTIIDTTEAVTKHWNKSVVSSHLMERSFS